MSIFDRIIPEVGAYVNRNTPAILTGLSVAGTVSTVVLAVRATPAALTDIWNAESEDTEPLKWQEKVKLTWRHYVPATIVGLLSIGTAIASQSVNHRRQAVLMGAYALTETSFREYREKTRELIGEKPEMKIRDELAKEHLESVPMVNSEVIFTGTGDHLCFDSMSSRYFRSDIEKIRKAVNDINEECLNHMNASQNEFYEKIGLPPTKFGDDVGWRFDHLLKLDTTARLMDDGTPALYLDYHTTPIAGYYKING